MLDFLQHCCIIKAISGVCRFCQFDDRLYKKPWWFLRMYLNYRKIRLFGQCLTVSG